MNVKAVANHNHQNKASGFVVDARAYSALESCVVGQSQLGFASEADHFVLFHEFDQIVDVSVASVLDWVIFLAFGREIDGGKALHSVIYLYTN